ncbi:MAG TPA: C45 family peptidase [Kofleriaceae bacterium]|nr:C45 family peptidase [Kofleriaceae bacterium]
MRTFELPPGSAREQGRAHGEMFRGEIGSLAEIRLYLCAQMSGGTRESVMQSARQHLPVLERYDRGLAEELVGIAEGAGLDPALVLVLNHYTDLRDLELGREHKGVTTDGCSAVYARTPSGVVVTGQTWDMHATSMPYVILMKVPAHEGRPGAWILSLTGCLGIAGMNARGVALCVNNLSSTDARVGVVWAALVRRALAQPTAASARDMMLDAPFGSGRHFLLVDREEAYGLEASGTRRSVVFSGEVKDYVHTNHCLDPVIGACTKIAEGATTFDRYRFLRDALDRAPIESAAQLWTLLGSTEGYPRSVCSNQSTPENPHGAATCAGLVMTPATGELLACAGFTHAATPLRFSVAQ